jgi:hemerythrin-like domain-containing protein
MSRPTHLLKHQHRVIEQAMRALEGMCLRIRAGGSVPQEDLSKLLYFIRHFADGFHHAGEELHLFPALRQIGIEDENGPLGFLRHEHGTERTLLAELELALDEYRHDPASGETFVSAALQFKDHLIKHMEQEEAILFRLAEEMLDDDIKDRLTQAFAGQKTEDPEMVQNCEQLAEELEKAWTL